MLVWKPVVYALGFTLLMPIFKYLIENLKYKPSAQEVLDMLTIHVPRGEQGTFFNYINKNFSPTFSLNLSIPPGKFG